MVNLSAASSTTDLNTAPAFVVGRDGEGHWLAVETHGLGGGFFITRDAALHYARSETAHRPGAIVLSTEPIALPRILSLSA